MFPTPGVLSANRSPFIGARQFAADGQPQTGALLGPGQVGIHLNEGLEDAGEFVRRDAVPGIANVDLHGSFALRPFHLDLSARAPGQEINGDSTSVNPVYHLRHSDNLFSGGVEAVAGGQAHGPVHGGATAPVVGWGGECFARGAAEALGSEIIK